MKIALCIGAFVLFGGLLAAQVQVDGRVSPGEYPNSIQALDGVANIAYAADGQGGWYFALTIQTTGWIGMGLGSHVMDGASIFMGFVRNGKAVFSEQKGIGHTHKPSTVKLADQSATGFKDGFTTIEFHIKAKDLPFQGKTFNYIVAFADMADLTSFHEDNESSGTITLP